MSIKRDPVENTEKYKKAMKEIQPILDSEFPEPYIGICHSVWCRQKKLLAERGIKWRTPQEMNPYINFD